MIAGAGRLPLHLLEAAERQGREVVVVALAHVALGSVPHKASACRWLPVGQLRRAADFLKGCGASELVFAGGVPWSPLAVRPQLDREALRLISTLPRGDDELLRAVARWFESQGLAVTEARELLEGLLAPAGLLAGPPLPPPLRALTARGSRAVRSLGRRDRGQAVLVSQRAIIEEGRRGTAALLRAARRLTREEPAILVKGVKPGQDLRFDRPAVGPETAAAAARAGLLAVVIQAGEVLMIDRPETLALARRRGLTVLSITAAELVGEITPLISAMDLP